MDVHCAVPAEANVEVTCHRLNDNEPQVVEIMRDDTASSAIVITSPTTHGIDLRQIPTYMRNF